MFSPLARQAKTLAAQRWYATGLPLNPDTYTRHRLRTLELHIRDCNGRHPVQVKETKKWMISDVERLMELVAGRRGEYNVMDWHKIASNFRDRTPDACKKKYNLLLRDATAATIAGARGKYNGNMSPRAKTGGTYDFLSSASKEWTAEDDKMLLALYEVWGTKWDKIAISIGRFTDSQCQSRYYWVRKKRKQERVAAVDPSRSKKRTSSASQQAKSEGPRDPPRTRKPASGDMAKRARWTETETKRLHDLLVEQGRFDYKEARKQLPGFSLAHIYYELDKVLSGPGHATGLWTSTEHEALLELTKIHDRDWRSISLGMPTRRSANQCRLHYAYCCSGPMPKKRWSADEEERLKLLVDLCQQGKLSASVPKHSASDLPPAETLSGIEELSGASLERFSGALKKDGQLLEPLINNTTPTQNQPSGGNLVSWPLVSLYMMTHTAAQCRAKWAYMTRVARDAGLYRGPWTREEDARLYELCQQAPNQWSWILQRLVRQRGSAAAKARYTTYISRYVNMLRKCRGAEWDPMADQFEEVHMRCEVLSWSRRQLEGYRPHDPHECLYDMDLTGTKNKSAAQPHAFGPSISGALST
ncbi:hypothetical protein GGI20_001413 [Coemansia sp. BCRC 34301]|nr:hypothetical protein GGI20_001413 [Coemansia sp. BCRC 34301]